MCGESAISKVRGTLIEAQVSGAVRPYKLIATYHPDYVLRQWEERSICVADLMKAKRESTTQDYTRPERELWLEPTLEDIQVFKQTYLIPATRIAVDIETAHGQITCIGFGTASHGICIPFTDYCKPGWNYWATVVEELSAWRLVKSICELPNTKLLQNGMYDIQWLWKKMGITLSGDIDDTMLLAHSMFPEMKKGLGFLGSIYTNESAWKKLRPKKQTLQKKDDA
jgi:hypothetical protein